jgi:hypothetical protein
MLSSSLAELASQYRRISAGIISIGRELYTGICNTLSRYSRHEGSSAEHAAPPGNRQALSEDEDSAPRVSQWAVCMLHKVVWPAY